jgi:hypothetical protein
MSLEPLETDLPGEMSARLDQALAVWRTHHQLDSARADAIRQAILESPATLPDEWWQNYLGYLNRALQQANRTSQDAANRSFKAMSQQWPWLKLTQSDASASRDWQPYLKLA